MRKLLSLPVSLPAAVLIVWVVLWPLLLVYDNAPAAAVLSVSSFILVVILIIKREGKTRPSLISGFLLIYLLLSLVAYFLSPIPDQSLRRLTALFAGAAGYGLALIWLKSNYDNSRLLASGLALVGGASSVLALFVVEWPLRFFVDVRSITDKLPHIGDEFFLNNNSVAGVLLLLLPMALVLFHHEKNRKRYVYLVSALSMLAVLLLMQSRNAFLGAIFAILASIFWGRIRFRFVFVILALLVILPLIAVGLSESTQIPGAEIVSTIDFSSKGGPSLDESWLGRLEMWSAAIKTMSDYPVIGAGLYAFAPVSRANYVYQDVYPHIDISHAHNLFLQTGASLGLVGWIVIVGLWITVLYALWQTSDTSLKADRWLPRALAAGAAGYIVFNSFDVLALEQRIGLFVWLFLALVSAVADASGFTGGRYRWLLLAPLALFAILLTTPGFPVNLARLQLDRSRIGRSTLPPSDGFDVQLGEDFRRLGIVQFMRGNKQEALRIWRHDPEAGLFLFNQAQQKHFVSQSLQEAIEWYTLSLAIDNESGASYFWRGEAFMELGENDRALVDFRSAAIHGLGEIYYGVPIDAMAWARQGHLHLDNDDLPMAIEAMKRAVLLAPDFGDYRQQLVDMQNLNDLKQ